VKSPFLRFEESLGKDGRKFAGAYVDLETYAGLKAMVEKDNRTVASLCRRIYDLALRGDIQIRPVRRSR
jgi:hypothetical protein